MDMMPRMRSFLKFPLIDEDIIPTLQHLGEPEQCDDLLPSEIFSCKANNSDQFEAQCDRQLSSLSLSAPCKLHRKLNIDTTKPFHTEDFFTGMLKAAALI
uniref:Uncharacterized protein n=1 Tax=Salix viminalis TaxID=40686 RepID=A0A6N2JXZ8_SALVM